MAFSSSVYLRIMHPSGQASAHLPQAVHCALSTDAQKFDTLTAPQSQAFMHLPQPIHAVLHAFFAAAPLSVFLHRTTAFAVSAGKISITCFGQAATH